MASLAWLNPPREVLELGSPERVFHSRQTALGMKIFIAALVVLALVSGLGLTIVRFYTRLIPKNYWTISEIASEAILGLGLLLLLLIFILRMRRPKYLYAFYNAGLVVYQKGHWG